MLQNFLDEDIIICLPLCYLILGSIEKMYSLISCASAEENYENSYLTMLSQPGLMFGIINIVGRLFQYIPLNT